MPIAQRFDFVVEVFILVSSSDWSIQFVSSVALLNLLAIACCW